jgi:hypothetical protein
MHREIKGNASHLMQINETSADELDLVIMTRILIICVWRISPA